MHIYISRFESYPSFSYLTKFTRLLPSSKAVKMMQKKQANKEKPWVKKKKEITKYR